MSTDKYFAEFHNSWSSLVISLIAAIGLAYGNPTKEWRFFLCNVILFGIGIGSFLLHMTLHSLPQSSDELPMLWISITYLYCLLEVNSPMGRPLYPHLPVILSFLTLVETVVYYMFQSFYAAFLVSFISITAANLITSALLMRDPSIDDTTRSNVSQIWKCSFYSFVIIGSGLWLLDMNFCSLLLPYYKKAHLGNMTFHVVWHITAGYGAYLFTIYIGALRAHALKHAVKLDWILGFFPVWRQVNSKMF